LVYIGTAFQECQKLKRKTPAEAGVFFLHLSVSDNAASSDHLTQLGAMSCKAFVSKYPKRKTPAEARVSIFYLSVSEAGCARQRN